MVRRRGMASLALPWAFARSMPTLREGMAPNVVSVLFGLKEGGRLPLFGQDSYNS